MSESPVDEAILLLLRRRAEMVNQILQLDDAVEQLRDHTSRSLDELRLFAEQAQSVEEEMFRQLPVRKQILSFLLDGRTASAEEIVAGIGGNPNTVRSMLSRMVQSGDLATPNRGHYHLGGAMEVLRGDLEPLEPPRFARTRVSSERVRRVEGQ